MVKNNVNIIEPILDSFVYKMSFENLINHIKTDCKGAFFLVHDLDIKKLHESRLLDVRRHPLHIPGPSLYMRKSCPVPKYDQTVYVYDEYIDQHLKSPFSLYTLWSIPSKEECEIALSKRKDHEASDSDYEHKQFDTFHQAIKFKEGAYLSMCKHYNEKNNKES